MMTTLYEKIGRRYVPVRDTDALDGLPNGTWLIDVKDGRRACLKAVDATPAYQALATIPTLEEFIAEQLREWSQSRPARAMTAKEKRAWAAYVEIMGENSELMLARPSAWDIATNVARKIAEMAGSSETG